VWYGKQGSPYPSNKSKWLLLRAKKFESKSLTLLSVILIFISGKERMEEHGFQGF
jgi:hypothetical protein